MVSLSNPLSSLPFPFPALPLPLSPLSHLLLSLPLPPLSHLLLLLSLHSCNVLMLTCAIHTHNPFFLLPNTCTVTPHFPLLSVLPALKPLVEHLFLRTPASLYADVKLLNAAREMVIEKMLRMLAYEGTMNLFTSILVCEERGDVKPTLARQILAALLPHLCKQQVLVLCMGRVHLGECPEYHLLYV